MAKTFSTGAGDSGYLGSLDSLRFAAAIWVAGYHGAHLPLNRMLPHGGSVAKVAIALNDGLFNGVAAVMLFFVISGFVIHRPNVGRSQVDFGSFYIRRLLRIVPPTIAAIVICRRLGPVYETALDGVLWSLICEIIYYVAYPLFYAAFRLGWEKGLLAGSFLISFVLIVVNWRTSYYWQLPIPVMALVGLPLWLLGCLLAEVRSRRGEIRDPGAVIWAWRLGAVALACLLKIPFSHGPLLIGYPAGHWLMSVYAYFWIDRELDHVTRTAASRLMEACGRASFSLYLVHSPVLQFFSLDWTTRAPLGGVLGSGVLALSAAWVVQTIVIGLVCAAFYFAMERPSHLVGRRLGFALAQRSAATAR